MSRLNWDPSHDWDKHADEQEQAAMAEVQFYAENKDALVTIVAALIQARPLGENELDAADITAFVDEAASIVRCIIDRGSDPYA